MLNSLTLAKGFAFTVCFLIDLIMAPIMAVICVVTTILMLLGLLFSKVFRFVEDNGCDMNFAPMFFSFTKILTGNLS